MVRDDKQSKASMVNIAYETLAERTQLTTWKHLPERPNIGTEFRKIKGNRVGI